MKIDTVNVGTPRVNPDKEGLDTGIDKRPVDAPVQVRDPGPKHGGLGSGIVGDFIGDQKHHGGSDQALYVVQREDLDRWEQRLGCELSNGFFGENLTTSGIDVNEARVGARWQLGDTVVVQVTDPRIPCNTFRGWVGEKGWLKTFTADARPGAYVSIVVPGTISSGDEITVLHRPDHDVTISLVYRAIMTEHDLLPQVYAAGDDLSPGLREFLER